MQLNEQQQKAVLQNGKHQLIVAGPGTGKTHTLTQKILHLMKEEGADPSTITAITFTSKAATEMKERIQAALQEGATWQKMPFIGTFHALSLHILRSKGHEFTILQPKQQEELMSEISSSKKLLKKQKKELQRVISLAKNQLISFEEIETFLEKDLLQDLYDLYAQTLEERQLYDFDDLLTKTLEILKIDKSFSPSHLFIDEYQDINEVQYRFIKQLIGEQTLVCAIGDPDQSIYAFRGSNFEHFLRFEKDFQDAITTNLEQNYRSSQKIVTTANKLITHNTKRIPKNIKAQSSEGVPITLHPFEDEWQESRFIAKEINKLIGGTDMLQSHSEEFIAYEHFHFSDIVVLYRTKAQARVIEEALKSSGLPYQCISSIPWYQKKEIQELLEYLQYIITPEESDRISEGQKVLLQGFIQKHKDLSKEKTSALVSSLIKHLKLEEQVEESTSKGRRIIENLQAFSSKAPMFDSYPGAEGLQNLLNHYAILQETDQYNPEAKAISLMTLHAAKGLEFPVVFITGLEENLLPFQKEGERTNIEEERRLFYVGITRAKARLYLSYALNRSKTAQKPSQFLTEIQGLIQKQDPPKSRKKKIDTQMSLL